MQRAPAGRLGNDDRFLPGLPRRHERGDADLRVAVVCVRVIEVNFLIVGGDAGGLPWTPPVAVVADVAARIVAGPALHADIGEILVTPMQKPTSAMSTPDGTRELSMFPREGQSGTLSVSKIAPSANFRNGIRQQLQ